MPRPSDPELEIEFLRRMMVKLGAPKEQASMAGASTAPTANASSITTVNGQPALLLNDALDRAWRRTGLALDRGGFTVEDRDRSKGLYYVRYVAPDDKQEDGFFARLFSSKPQQAGLTRYQIRLQASQGDKTLLHVMGQDGAVENSENANKILKLLAAEMR